VSPRPINVGAQPDDFAAVEIADHFQRQIVRGKGYVEEGGLPRLYRGTTPAAHVHEWVVMGDGVVMGDSVVQAMSALLGGDDTPGMQ